MTEKLSRMDGERKQQILVFFEMLLISMAANALAPLIVVFQKTFQISMGQAAIFPVLLTAGGISANILGSLLIANVGVRRYNYLFFITLLITSILFLKADTLFMLYSAIFFLGFNTATGLAVTSTVLSHLSPKYQNFGLFNAFFGFGGMITPAIIYLLLKNDISYNYIFYGFIILGVLTWLFILKAKFLPEYKYKGTSLKDSFSILKMPVVHFTLLIFVFYAGSELGMVLWSSNLFTKAYSLSAETSAIYISGFWMLFALARMSTNFIEKRFSFNRLLTVLPILAVALLTLLLVNGWPIIFLIMALCLGPIFPLTQKYAIKHLPKSQAGMFNNLVFGFISVGNVMISSLMGIMGNWNIFAAFVIPGVGFLLVVLFSGLLYRNGKN